MTSDLRAIKVVWHREMLRFFADKPRIFTSLLQPLLYLFVLGSGLGAMMGGLKSFRVFMFPGITTMAVLFTCFFSAGSIVWDRELGFMREMMVAPVGRGAIIVGKCLGGATAGAFQAVILLAIGGLVGVPYDPLLLVTVLAELLLVAFTVSALALALAARIRSIQSFMALMQMTLMPLFFLSGAMYPLRGLPGWLQVVTRLDPLTYAVDPIRRTVLARAHVPVAALTWSGWAVPIGLELAVLAAFALAALSLAIVQFRRAE